MAHTTFEQDGAGLGGSRTLDQVLVIASRHRQPLMLAFLSLVAGCVLIGAILYDRGYPSRDSGVFLQVAQEVLDGKIPYRDVWDHKPPAIFYVDALGLTLGHGSIAGVWLLELLSLWLGVFLSARVLGRAFGSSAAFFGSMTWLIGLILLLFKGGGPNLSEEYVIPVKFAAFWLFLQGEEKGYLGRRGLAVGVTAAAALLFRQNLIGVHLAIALHLLWTRLRVGSGKQLLAEYLWVVSGAVAVLAPVAAYFAANSALGDLVDATVRYNIVYSATDNQTRLASVVEGFEGLTKSGVGILALASWFAGLAFLATNQPLSADARRLLRLAALALPLEVLLASVSGRSYGHYYISWLPVVAVLAAFFARCLLAPVSDRPLPGAATRAAMWQASILLAMLVLPAQFTIPETLPQEKPASPEAHAAWYVREFTRPEDYVLVWGAEPSINFVSERRSPTKYVYQYPLYTSGYQTAGMVREFLREISECPPALIVDMSPVDSNVPPVDANRRQRWEPNEKYRPLPEMAEVFEYLKRNYRERGPLVQPDGAVFVYERVVASR